MSLTTPIAAVPDSSGGGIVSAVPDALDQYARSGDLFADQLAGTVYRLAATHDAAFAGAGAWAGRMPSSAARRVGALGEELRALGDHVRIVATRFRSADVGTWVGSSTAQASANSIGAAFAASVRGRSFTRWHSGWQLLRFSTADRGRLVEFRGDLVGATHIVVLVPGMTNSLQTVESLRSRADAVYAELVARALPGQRPAVVMWLGYRNPQISEPWAAVGSGMARRGADDLRADVSALAAGSATITVVAHSYGTIVAGEAMKRGLSADRVVVLGSPGMNAWSRSQLGSPQVELFATAVQDFTAGSLHQHSDVPRQLLGLVVTPMPLAGPAMVSLVGGRDWAATTSDAGVHGTDPTKKSFGANVFASDGRGHAAAFVVGSLGLANMALIALEQTPARRKRDLPRLKSPRSAINP